jgi:predicted amidohydrolase YtcJ
MSIRALYPDLILLGGKICTLDDENTIAQAVAVRDGRIVAVGRDDEMSALAGPDTRRLNLAGRTVIPGIFDSHIHLMSEGAKLSAIRLDECQSPKEMLDLARERAADTPPGEWVIGQGWNEGNFPGGELPTRHDIDPATAEHPVLLKRFFNTYLVNSYALRLAGIDRHTPDPDGGKIERDADGKPNGLLRANAKALIDSLVPQPTHEEMRESLRLACVAMHRYGITSIIDPGLYAQEIRAYQSLYRDGELSVRASLMPNWYGFRDEAEEAILDYRPRALGVYTGLGDEWLRIGSLKMMLDGGTSPRTAYMYEPYEGDTELVVSPRLEPDALLRYLRVAQELEWDVAIHTCGDRAMDMGVDALARVAREIPRPDARHSIIHAYFPSPRALDQMAEHHIAAVIQPTFIYWEGDLIFRDVGEKRVENYIPARKYLDRGIVVTASSDVPATVSPNPFVALYALVTRKNNLNHYIAPHEAIGREEALRAYTASGAWLTREESLKGTIEVGKLADMAVLDRDYFAVPSEEIKEIQVDVTIVGGEVVWERE